MLTFTENTVVALIGLAGVAIQVYCSQCARRAYRHTASSHQELKEALAEFKLLKSQVYDLYIELEKASRALEGMHEAKAETASQEECQKNEPAIVDLFISVKSAEHGLDKSE